MTLSRRSWLAWTSWFISVGWNLPLASRSTLSGDRSVADRPAGEPGKAPAYIPSFLHPNDQWVHLPGLDGTRMELWNLRTGDFERSIPLGPSLASGLGESFYLHAALDGFNVDGSFSYAQEIHTHDASTTAFDWRPGHEAVIRPEDQELSYKRLYRFLWETWVPSDFYWKARQSGPETAEYWEEISPTGRWRMVLNRSGSTDLRIDDLATSTAKAWTPAPSTPSEWRANCLAFTPNEDEVWLGLEDRVFVWSWAAGKDLRPMGALKAEGFKAQALCASRDGSKAWVAFSRPEGMTQGLILLGRTRLMEFPSRREFVPPLGQWRKVDLVLSRDQRLLAVRYGAATVRAYDVATGRMTRLLAGHMPPSALLAFGSSPQHLLAARPAGEAWVWYRQGPVTRIPGNISAEFLDVPPAVSLAASARSLAWSQDDRLLAVGGSEGEIRMFEAATALLQPSWGERAKVFRKGELHPGLGLPHPPKQVLKASEVSVRGLQFFRGQLLALHGDGLLRVWDVRQGKAMDAWQAHPVRASALAVAPEQGWLATGGHDGVGLWNLKGIQKRSFDLDGHWVAGLAFSPDGARLAVASLEGAVRVFELESGRLVWSALAHEGWASAVAYSPDGSKLASGGEDGRVHFWAPGDGKRLASGKVHGHALAWSRDGHWLACNGVDRVRVVTANLKYEDKASNRLFLDWADEFT